MNEESLCTDRLHSSSYFMFSSLYSTLLTRHFKINPEATAAPLFKLSHSLSSFVNELNRPCHIGVFRRYEKYFSKCSSMPI